MFVLFVVFVAVFRLGGVVCLVVVFVGLVDCCVLIALNVFVLVLLVV